ncbi:MAG TPA: integrase [Sulfitobacter sp.]|uniref:tyrosine-type recombinase/integrase n=2 Tax=unclassified Sulfitobacter TaxID=196795 RepID=UPI000EDA6A24|nr:tyrosine-type recombinase/integrase [Sulfitobacter sp.]HCQ56545.1 integrase [Sulfitobacter sp.]|tara:strand:- start:119 stop:1195 length:1077 start_codon:yes stop_codon:yes gene_type:complete
MPRGNLPPEVHRVKAKLVDGTVCYYFSLRGRRGTGFWKDARPFPKSPNFFTAYSAAMARALPKPNTLMTEAVVDAYISSAEFLSLKPRTQSDYRRWAMRFAVEFESDPVAMFEDAASRAEVNQWRSKWNYSPKQYDYAGTVVTRILNWAREQGKIAEHHCSFAKVYRSDRSDVVWTPVQVEAVRERAPEWVGRILVTACETGMRPGDLVRLSKAHIESTPGGRRIRIKTNKRGKSAFVPVSQAMAEIIDATPNDRLLILANASGGPLTEHRASEGVRQWRNKAGLTPNRLGYDLRLYDARGTAATRLLRAGLSLAQIAGCMGWSLRTAAAMIERYAQVSPDETDAVLTLLNTAKEGRT